MPKKVSDHAMQAVSDAIDAIGRDDSLSRTKREIEKLTGLSHATVARAFVQDQDAVDVSRWRLQARFTELTMPTGRRSVHAANTAKLKDELASRDLEIKELHQQIALYQQIVYLQYVATRTKTKAGGVAPIGVNRDRRQRW